MVPQVQNWGWFFSPTYIITRECFNVGRPGKTVVEALSFMNFCWELTLFSGGGLLWKIPKLGSVSQGDISYGQISSYHTHMSQL